MEGLLNFARQNFFMLAIGLSSTSVIPKFDDSAYSHVGGRIALDETMH